MGLIPIPEQFQGTGAPGNTLEYLMNIEENNFDSPDYKDWEIKFHGGNSYLTLCHNTPQPEGIMDRMVDVHGWDSKKTPGQINFRHTIWANSKRGFKIVDKDKRIYVTNPKDDSLSPYWDHNIILGAIAAKFRRLIIVHGKVSPDKRGVTYLSADAYWDLKLLWIIDYFSAGIIAVDFDARTTKERGSSLRDHGTKFRIRIKQVGELYENHQKII